jgi:uncharacterized protein (DUF305 family)
MRRRTSIVGVATLAGLVVVGACSSAGNDQAAPTTVVTSTSVSATEAHNHADATFAQRMIPHHQQAIEMSDMLLGKQGIDQRVLDLATQIKAAQAPEIEQMQSWLTQWGMPTMPMTPGMDMPGHRGMPTDSVTPGETATPTQSMTPGMSGMPGGHGMDGMMSEEDMAALRSAQGTAAARLYLTQMIKHHQGAISMAQTEINSGQYPAAIALAHSIDTNQRHEIDTMNKILASL